MPGSVLEMSRGAGHTTVPSAGRGRGERRARPCRVSRYRANPPWPGAGCRGTAAWGGMQAYAGCLPHVLEEALGWDEELEQAAEPISPVAGLQQPKHLAQDGGGRGFEGGVEGLEGTLHRRIQRPGVLQEESVAGGESGPAMGCRHPPMEPVPTIPRCTATPRLCQVPGTPTLAMPLSSGVSKPSWAGNWGGTGCRAHQAPRSRRARARPGPVPSVGLWFKKFEISPKRSRPPHSRTLAVRRRRSRSSQGVKLSQTRSVGMCWAQRLAVGMQRMGGRTNI